MKKIGIVTIIDCNNYGNRLQCYALQSKINTYKECEAYQLLNYSFLNQKKLYTLKYLKHILNLRNYSKNKKRKYNFKLFENNITYYKKIYSAKSKVDDLDYCIVGSDQVWNPYFGRLRDMDLLVGMEDKKKISYAASFGISSIPEMKKIYVSNELKRFKAISVREDDGKKIVENLTNRNDIEVVIDPTMLLSKNDWKEISKKPKNMTEKKYILNYFLGDISKNKADIINKFAEDNNYEVINILDKNSKYYECGPSEFLYLIDNAELICTDSFHSCVFSILFDKSFVVFDRENEKHQTMSSRIETLINKFKLDNRKFNGIEITKENICHDYTNAYKVLDEERKKANEFLKKALDIC